MAAAPIDLSFAFTLRSTASPVGMFNPAPPPVRRRGSFEQGRALEILGHAIEYLSDSRMFSVDEAPDRARAEADAIQIMTRASRAVFMECAEAVPLHRRVGRWLSQHLVSSDI